MLANCRQYTLCAVTAGVNEPEQISGRRRYVVFAVVSAALLMGSIDQTIVATALDTLHGDLHASVSWTSWTITIYSLFQILVLPIAGVLSDHFGRRRLLLGAIAVFTVGSLCCGLSTNIGELILFRAVQAIGGGAFMPTATGVVADVFHDDRDRAIGLFTSIFPVGAFIGPVLGGVLVTYCSWRAIFLVNLPIGVLLFFLAVAYLPHDVARGASWRMDYLGVGLLCTGLLGTMFAISELAHPRSIQFLAPLTVGLIALVLFVHREQTIASPFVPLQLLRGRAFAIMNVINLLTGAAFFGTASLLPLYAQSRYDLSPLSSGALLTIRAVGTFAVSALAVLALRRTGYRLPMIVGFALAAIGTGLLAYIQPGADAYPWLTVASVVAGLGSGIILPAANNATISLAPDSAASITGLRGMFRQAGGITGVSLAGTVVSGNGSGGSALTDIFTGYAVILGLLAVIAVLVPSERGKREPRPELI